MMLRSVRLAALGTLLALIGAACVTVTKTDAPDPVTPGGTLTYTIVVEPGEVCNPVDPTQCTELGDDDVTLTDDLPSEVTFVSVNEDVCGDSTEPIVISNTVTVDPSEGPDDVDTEETTILCQAGGVSCGVGGAATLETQDISDSSGTNVQEGDNRARVRQSSDVTSGDAVAGQVIGLVVTGDVTINATNSSIDVRVRSGDASGSNTSTVCAGLVSAGSTPTTTSGDAVRTEEAPEPTVVIITSSSDDDDDDGSVAGGKTETRSSSTNRHDDADRADADGDDDDDD